LQEVAKKPRHLDPHEFQLGTGDRALVRGGRIHPRHRIVVPPEFVQPDIGNADVP
jgi:hypothetical protein